jgi:hypothetical protein
VANKPRKLRCKVRDGQWSLFLGNEKIAAYTMRAAAEQVVENWLKRRAAGETDAEIIAAQGYRPTRPISGTPKWVEAEAKAAREESAALRAELADRRKIASEGGKARGRRPWEPHAIPIADPMLRAGLKPAEIIRKLRREWVKHPEWPKLPGEPLPVKKTPSTLGSRFG